MTKTPTAVEAKRWLVPVSPEWKAFWFNKGAVVKSMKEMVSILPKVPPHMFEHHVNAKKNDLASWVKDVVGDEDLAKELRSVKTQKAAADAFAKRVSMLEKILLVAPSVKPAKKK